MTWALFGLVIVWCFAGGLFFRAGHLRWMGQWYDVPALPAPIRHLPLQLVPIGVFLSTVAGSAALAPREEVPASPEWIRDLDARSDRTVIR